MAKAWKRGKGRQKSAGKREKNLYVMLKIEKMWGRKSNAKREGGGKESKAIEPYTPL